MVADIATVGDAFSQGVSLATVTASAYVGVSALCAFLDPISDLGAPYVWVKVPRSAS